MTVVIGNTLTITNVPKEIIQRWGTNIAYPTLSWDGMDRIYEGEVLPKKEDAITWLQARIDMIRGETTDADEYFASYSS